MLRAPSRLASPLTRRVRGGRAARGVTLVEVLVVVALIAVIGGSVIFGSGMLSGSRQRAAGTLLVVAVQKGIAHANTSGKPVRLAMDLAGGHVRLEAASTSKVLRDNPQDAAGLEARARQESDRALDTSAPAAPSFTPLDVLGDDTDGKKPAASPEGEEGAQPDAAAGTGRSIGTGVKFRMVQTEHDAEPQTEGTAYLYFWPGGITEQAVIQLTRGPDDDGLTVQVSPLTGRAVIKPGRVPLPEPRADGEYSEREETL